MQKLAAYLLERRDGLQDGTARTREADRIRSEVINWLTSKGGSYPGTTGIFQPLDGATGEYRIESAADAERTWWMLRLVPPVRSPGGVARVPRLRPVGPVEGLVGVVVPTHVGVDIVAESLLRGKGSSREDSAFEDTEHALDLIHPGGVLRREVSSPSGVVIEPVEHVVGVVGREVVADEVAASLGIAEIDDIEEVHKGQAVVVLRNEAEELATADIKGAHQREGAVPDVLGFAADDLARRHRDVGVAPFERLHPCLFVQADDVLIRGGFIVEAQDIVSLAAKLIVLRRQPHLLTMRLQERVAQNAPDAGVADLDAQGAHTLPEETLRPVCDRNAYVTGGLTGFGLDFGAVALRERARGRPERGASAIFWTGSSTRNRARHFSTVRGWTPMSFAMSTVATSSAISSAACARRTRRTSALWARITISIPARCSAESSSGTARGPEWWRCAHGVASIMRIGVHDHLNPGQISGQRH